MMQTLQTNAYNGHNNMDNKDDQAQHKTQEAKTLLSVDLAGGHLGVFIGRRR